MNTIFLAYKRNLFCYPMTNCYGACDCDPLGYNRRSNDITGLLIQHTLQTEFRSTHLDMLNTGETKYVKLIIFSVKVNLKSCTNTYKINVDCDNPNIIPEIEH